MPVKILRHSAWTVLLRINDYTGIASRCSFQVMMMRMFHRSVAVVVTLRVGRLLITLVMLQRRVVALVVVESAVWVHDNAACFVQRR